MWQRCCGASQNPFGCDSVENAKISNQINLMRDIMRKNIHTVFGCKHRKNLGYNSALLLQLYNVLDRNQLVNNCASSPRHPLNRTKLKTITAHRYMLILLSRLTFAFFIRYGRYGKINQFSSILHISKVFCCLLSHGNKWDDGCKLICDTWNWFSNPAWYLINNPSEN